MKIRDQLKENIQDVYGQEGSTWLNHLPELLANLSRRWGFTQVTPFENLTYSYSPSTDMLTTDDRKNKG